VGLVLIVVVLVSLVLMVVLLVAEVLLADHDVVVVA
jgi:hypothetical protein